MEALKSSRQEDPNDALWRDLMNAARHDDGAAAQEHLDAGFPIYYAEEGTPEGLLIKEHPDGRRELVRVVGEDDEVIRIL
ncbi:MAG: hypothetical protein K9H25_17330 [Rhodospirillum sp.]|nr:hypothetical protein [Rhodospirillum sp.]MCF8502884.1 hypothetical protein [Rhodospirillum sp.]